MSEFSGGLDVRSLADDILARLAAIEAKLGLTWPPPKVLSDKEKQLAALQEQIDALKV